MGWGIMFKGDIQISKPNMVYTEQGVKNYVKSLEESIEESRKIILMYSIATPKDIISDNTNSVGEIKEIIEEYIIDIMETTIKINYLYLLLEYLKENPEVDISELKY